MKKRTLYTFCLLLLAFVTHAQVSGDYRSIGDVDLNLSTNWETFSGSWAAAGTAPNAAGLTTGNTITIQSGNTWGNTDDVTIPVGVKLVFQGTTATAPFTAGKTITINGTLENQNTLATGAISTVGNIVFASGSTYLHNTDVTNMPRTNTTYASGSTINVIGCVTLLCQIPLASSNVIWNCPNQTATNQFVFGSPTTITGDFTVISTGASNAIHIGGGGTSRSLTVTGNLIMTGGELRLANAGSTVSQTINVTGNISIASGSKIYLSGSTSLGTSGIVGAGKLNVKGNFTNAGTFGNVTGATVRSSTLTFNNSITSGTQAFTTVPFSGDSVHVTINTTGATTPATITFNSDVTLVKGLFTLTAGSLIISAGKYLTLGSTGANTFTSKDVILKSDATGTAGIGKITGSITSTSKIWVERYIPSSGRKKYVLVTSPLTSILSDWQEGTPGGTFVAGTAGYGTQITKGVAQGTNGFDGPATSTASIFTYNDDNGTGSKWVAYAGANGTTTASSLSPTVGYLLFVRGDRSEDRTVAPFNSSNTVLRSRGANFAGAGAGTLGRGSYSPVLNTNAGKFTLIGNPYSCPIDWNSGSITKTGLTGIFTVYDPNLGVFVTSDGTTVTPQSGSGTSKQQAQYIQSGQAFFVQNDASGTHSIGFAEGAKVTTPPTAATTTVFGEAAVKQQLNINVFRNENNAFADGAVALFGKSYNAAVDVTEDFAKFTNFSETFGLRRGNNILGLEARPSITSNDTLYCNLSNFSKRDYSLVIDGSNFSNTTATLEDTYTNTKQPLDLAGTTTHNFTVNSDAASASNNRFIITFGSTATSTIITDAPSAGLFVKMSPNPVSNLFMVSFRTATVEQTTINVVNSLGQIVKTVNAGKVDAGNISIPVVSLSTGVYTVQLLSGDKQISTQKIIKQ